MKSVTTDVVIYTDGAALGNPGPAGAGAVLYSKGGTLIALDSYPMGSETNNVAEYMGAIRGLQLAETHGAKTVTLRCDSQLVINQLNGTYRVKSPSLIELYSKAKELLQRFDSVVLEQIPREENDSADRLAGEAAVLSSRQAKDPREEKAYMEGWNAATSEWIRLLSALPGLEHLPVYSPSAVFEELNLILRSKKVESR